MTVTCTLCGKTFNSDVSLQQHTQAKHSKKEILLPKKSNLHWIIFLAVLLFLAIIASQWYFSHQSTTEGNYDTFAQCLTDKGAKFYGTFWCPHCKEQKKLFGSSLKFVPYIECSTPDGNNQLDVCKEAGVDGYPTWVFADGVQVSGTQTLEFLSEKTGCPLVTDEKNANETQQ